MIIQIQMYALIFLLGSLTVASLSDIRRMAAQKDFAEVWALFTLVALIYDALSYDVLENLLIKWFLIVLFALVAFQILKKTASLSVMDLAAVTAVASLLTPATILLYYFVLFVLKELTNPILKKFGAGGATPFLPVVWAASILIFAFLAYSM